MHDVYGFKSLLNGEHPLFNGKDLLLINIHIHTYTYTCRIHMHTYTYTIHIHIQQECAYWGTNIY